jgi:hypothetical protein
VKALYELSGQPGKVEGPAVGVLNRIEKLSEDETFVAHKLFVTNSEGAALADFDEQSDLLDQFTIIADDEQRMTFNAKAGYVSNITYQAVTEDDMTHNEIIRQEVVNALWGNQEEFYGEPELVQSGSSGHFNPLDVMSLYDDDEDQEYSGASGSHSSTGSFNQQKGMSRSVADVEPLDLMVMNWDEPKRAAKATTNKRADRDEVAPLDLMPMEGL